MHIWSQIARLGAFLAAFGPPSPDRDGQRAGEDRTANHRLTDQPVAEAVDVDAQPTRDELANVNLPDDFAAIPNAIQPPAPPNDNGDKRQSRRTATPVKPEPIQRRMSRGWHGAGQRYG